VASHRRTRDPWPAPRNTTPDSPAFHCVALRSANGRPRAHAQPPPRRRSQRKRRHCPGARREASLTLRCVPLRENRRDRRGRPVRLAPPASASPVLAPETFASSLASAAAWSCAGPQVSLTSGHPGSALGLTAHPVTLEPRPGAEPGRPEVRTARAPATQTKRARLPAFSTGQDGAEKLADWRLGGGSQSGLWLSRPTRPSSLPPQPAQPEARTARPPRPARTATPPVGDPLRSGCGVKDASDSQPQEQLYIAAQRPHRHPLRRTPGAGVR
jgi:hypothetical protein